MNSSLYLLKYIRETIQSNEDLNTMIGLSIYPIVVNSRQDFPFIVYNREFSNPQYCKDGSVYDEGTFTLTIVSNLYDEVVSISQLVRETFENLRNDTWNLLRIKDMTEYYDDERQCYVENIKIDFKLK